MTLNSMNNAFQHKFNHNNNPVREENNQHLNLHNGSLLIKMLCKNVTMRKFVFSNYYIVNCFLEGECRRTNNHLLNLLQLDFKGESVN